MSRLDGMVYGLVLIGFGALLGTWMVAPEERVRAFGETIGGWLGLSNAYAEEAAGTFSPVQALAVHEAYYPGTKDIAPDEMRLTACGTGMPSARPKQAAACFLVELGNGDKFIFDIGSGSAERLSALASPYDYLDKVFIGHLHSDHFGDLGDLWVGGVISNRQVPLRVWGPNSTKDDIRVRMAVVNEDVWPLPSTTEKLPADPDDRVGFTQFLLDGREIFTDIVQAVYDETNAKLGTDVAAPN